LSLPAGKQMKAGRARHVGAGAARPLLQPHVNG
jgi:hypothetical protein